MKDKLLSFIAWTFTIILVLCAAALLIAATAWAIGKLV